MAPEVLNHKHNMACDIWSTGVLMFYLLSGEYPFNGRTEKKLLEKYSLIKTSILAGKYSFERPPWANISDDAKQLITNLLTYNPKNRIKADQALKDKWFEKISNP